MPETLRNISRRQTNSRSILTGVRRAGTIATISAVLLVFLPSCRRPDTTSEPAKPRNPLNTARTEQLWIVGSIVHDIADMAVYASNRKTAPLPADAVTVESQSADSSGYHYSVTVRLPGDAKPLKLPVDISGAVWAPTAYQPFARTLLETLKLTGSSEYTSTGENPLGSLIYPSAAAIQRQNKRVSAFLTEHPLSREAHEQAALIVGTLGMRENSGKFWDTRQMCNRAVAHLAFAGAIRGNQPMSDSGEIGELLVGLLDDTKKDCEQRIARLKERAQKNSELYPWLVASQLRNRRDWRILDNPKTASLLERIEYFRARCESVSPNAASRELLENPPENVADWYCIILQFHFSVEAGHVFTEAGLGREFKEIIQIFPDIQARKLDPNLLAETLNRTPGGVVQRDASGDSTILPIDDGMWAHYFQRHLCHIADRTDHFLRDMWAVPDQAAQFEAAIGKLFAKLTFAPLMRVMWNSPRHPDLECATPAVELVNQHPEWIPDAVWEKIPHTAAARVPSARNWFSPCLPAGTAYCYYGRSDHLPQLKNLSADALKKLYDLAPWHYGVAFDYVKALYGEKPTSEQFRSVMGPFLDFNVNAMLWYAYYAKDDVKECVATYQRIAKLDPNTYLTLSDYYREHQMEAESMESLQAAIDNHADSVSVTHLSGRLVNYYFDHGQKDRALAIATDAAEVYSAAGLTTMADLQERMGNIESADSYFEKIKERYDDSAPLTCFYQRQATLHPDSGYAAKAKSSIGSIFPGGMASAKLADFSDPPKKGVIIAGQNEFLLQCGLKKGSIIVALDGKRTETFLQYSFVRELTKSPHMEFIVFQDGKYQEVKAEVPERRFGLDFRSWP